MSFSELNRGQQNPNRECVLVIQVIWKELGRPQCVWYRAKKKWRREDSSIGNRDQSTVCIFCDFQSN